MDGPQALSESLRTEGAQTDPCSQHSAQMWAEAPEAGAHITCCPPSRCLSLVLTRRVYYWLAW